MIPHLKKWLIINFGINKDKKFQNKRLKYRRNQRKNRINQHRSNQWINQRYQYRRNQWINQRYQWINNRLLVNREINPVMIRSR